MAKVRYDVSDVETGNFEQPKPGFYSAKIAEVNQRQDNGKNDLEVIIQVVGGEFDGSRLWTYVHLGDASRWKLREFADALGLPPKGTLDTSKMEGRKLRIKASEDSWQGEYRARVQRMLKAGEDDDADNGDDDDNGEEGTATATATVTSEDYTEWDLEDLKAEIADRELVITGRKTKEKMIEALEIDDDEQSGGTGTAEAEPEDDYDDWEQSELVAEVEDRKLTMPAGRKTKEKLIAVLREDDAEEAF